MLADVGVVVSFGYFLPSRLLEQFPQGCINVHPSLLPRFRGAAPIQHAILQGDTETGVTVQEVSPKAFDAGKILSQVRVPLPPDVDYPSLEATLSDVGSHLLLDTLRNYVERKANARNQEGEGQLASKVTKEMAKARWGEQTALEMTRAHRALGHRTPIFSTFRGMRIQLRDMVIDEASKDHLVYPPGTVTWTSGKRVDHVRIQCADGTSIRVRRIRLEGKRDVDVREWVSNYTMKSGGEVLGLIEPGQHASE
ncbi:MAG: formyl transferase [Piptocephalis tieghemiana]|nr:MAG: formyl transferase [Piptocephalis tieghemiana]